ncbi:transposase [Anaerobacillus sp. HL2]|nr:transposase [Anaerobacillus sp. HL2]
MKKNLSGHQTENLLKLKDSDLKQPKPIVCDYLFKHYGPLTQYLLRYFDEWYTWAIRSRLEPMISVARSLKAHENGILRWFTSRMTNGLLEGINN